MKLFAFLFFLIPFIYSNTYAAMNCKKLVKTYNFSKGDCARMELEVLKLCPKDLECSAGNMEAKNKIVDQVRESYVEKNGPLYDGQVAYKASLLKNKPDVAAAKKMITGDVITPSACSDNLTKKIFKLVDDSTEAINVFSSAVYSLVESSNKECRSLIFKLIDTNNQKFPRKMSEEERKKVDQLIEVHQQGMGSPRTKGITR